MIVIFKAKNTKMSHKIPEWLEDIQNRSWEPELLISGGAIFFLFQITDFLQYRSYLLFQQSGYFEGVAIASFLIAAINALIMGFVLHLIVRGFWVAAITLSYVFPAGIQLDKIHYPDKFKEKIRRVPDTEDWVIWTETASSLIFSLSFFFSMLILAVLLCLIIIVPHSSLQEMAGERVFYLMRLFSYFLLFLGVIYLIDFLTLGWVKKQKWLTRIYHPIYIFFSIITIAPLYRTTYYTIVSNVRPWIVVTVVSGYLLLAAFISQFNYSAFKARYDIREFLNIYSNEYEFAPRYYENMRKEGDLVQHCAIQSDVVKDQYLKIFIVHQKVIERLMEGDCLQKASEEARKLNCYGNFYRVYVDDQFYPSVKWKNFIHPKTQESGIIAFLPIRQLNTSEHQLKIVLNIKSRQGLSKVRKFGMKSATYARIPFWKE